MNIPTQLCELCGHPMPSTEVMFRCHGYSGPCPAPPLPAPPTEADTLRARIAELQARLSRAENVCKAADKAPCRHSNDHTELGCEVCDALAAWREGK